MTTKIWTPGGPHVGPTEPAIDPIPDDIRRHAENWQIPVGLIHAVDRAEGGGDHLLKAVQCSLPKIVTRDQAIDVVCRSAVHAAFDLLNACRDDFVAFWGARWAPLGVENDPRGLNANWVKNVETVWNETNPIQAKTE